MLAQIAVLTLALPAFVSGALFPPNTKVKSIDAKGFRKAMSTNDTSIVAFVAPWCGHCQRMGPELSKAAKGLDPLVPVYAVDCDADQNKPLCAQQGVQGFPTVKLYPRGKTLPPKPFDGQDRTAPEFFNWAERNIPQRSKKLYETKSIEPWITENTSSERLLLLTKAEKVPLLWNVLANKYRDNFKFAYHRDRKGKSSVALGFEAGGEKESKLLVYPKGSTTPVRYEGLLKLDPLSKFFDSIIDGTADLGTQSSESVTSTAESVTAEASTSTSAAASPDSVAEPEAEETVAAVAEDAESGSEEDVAPPVPEEPLDEPIATPEATPKHEEL